MDATAAWTAVGAFGTLAAACVAAVAAWQSRESSRQANAAATALAAIERDRRHDELTPEFDLAFIPLDGDQAKLKVTLTGGGMDSLANVILTILNEDGQESWTHGLPEGITLKEAERSVWGPWEFDTRAAGDQILSNRKSWPRPYSLVDGNNWDMLSLNRTRPPRWIPPTAQDTWRRDRDGHPIRIQITCTAAGFRPWRLLKEVAPGWGTGS